MAEQIDPRNLAYLAHSCQSPQEASVLDFLYDARRDELKGDDMLSFLSSSLSPGLLTSPECMRNPHIFVPIKNLMVKYAGIVIPERMKHKRIAIQVMSLLFDGDILETCLQIESESAMPRRSNSQQAQTFSLDSQHIADNRSKAYELETRAKRSGGVSQRMQNHLFDGTKLDVWPNTLATYDSAVSVLTLTEDEQLQFFELALTGTALRYFRSLPDVKSLKDAKERMRSRYVPEAAQRTIHRELSSLSLARLKSEGKSERESLDALFETINTRSQLLPAEHRSDRSLCEYLRSAVISESWALAACELQASSGDLTLYQFFQRLLGAVLSKAEVAAAKQRAFSETHNISYVAESETFYSAGDEDTYFGARYRGHRDRKRGSRIQDRSNVQARGQYNRPRTRGKCFACRSPDHWLSQCPNRNRNQSMIDIVRDRLRDPSGASRKAQATYIAELCMELDAITAVDRQEDPNVHFGDTISPCDAEAESQPDANEDHVDEPDVLTLFENVVAGF
jgi:hypothetical protein